VKHPIVLAAAVLLLAGVGHSGIITLSGTISGANENPATPSLGTGFALVTLDTTAQTLEVNVFFSNLLATIPGTSTPSGTTASHIHCCVAPPGNAGVATTTPSFTGFPLGVDSGSFDRVLDLTMSSSYNPAFITAQGSLSAAETALENGLMSSQTYLNIHTNAFPGGEVRAFLTPTPEPMTGVLALAGFGALWLIRRQRPNR
jgi:MYXO-CTERM domain-containing protein